VSSDPASERVAEAPEALVEALVPPVIMDAAPVPQA
jgi:hypothetical protein